jgi:hypothetical protein
MKTIEEAKKEIRSLPRKEEGNYRSLLKRPWSACRDDMLLSQGKINAYYACLLWLRECDGGERPAAGRKGAGEGKASEGKGPLGPRKEGKGR